MIKKGEKKEIGIYRYVVLGVVELFLSKEVDWFGGGICIIEKWGGGGK